ncbi:MAG: carbohydrate binding domain-containing protein, partial [bacterium]|nr:carbohydrate binding domain-containing protein [bacterium]
NGRDDDCDGTVDEGFELNSPCDGADADGCDEGVTICSVDGRGTICNDTTGNTVEVCDGLDNDCDGVVDNGVRGPNLVVNGSFETGTAPWTIHAGGDGSATRDCSASAFEGTCAVRLANPTIGGWESEQWYQLFTTGSVESNRQYVLRFAGRSTQTGQLLAWHLIQQDYPYTPLWQELGWVIQPLTSDWTVKTVVFRTTAGAGASQPRLTTYFGGELGPIGLDGVELYRCNE